MNNGFELSVGLTKDTGSTRVFRCGITLFTKTKCKQPDICR